MLSNASRTVVVVSSIFSFVATLAVVLRFYARRLKLQSFQADDYLVLLALVVTIAICAVYIVGATIGGIGAHIQDVTQNELIRFGKISFAVQFIMIANAALVRFSILFFYRRIFPGGNFKIAIHMMGLLVVVWSITFFFATLFQALPISANWTGEPSAQINRYAMYTAGAAFEMFLDVSMLVMVWPVIWQLQMDTRHKRFISGIFLLGGFVCIATLVRLYYFTQHLDPTAQEAADFTYTLAPISIWSAIAPCLRVICACLPVLGPIFQTRASKSVVGSLKGRFALRSLSNSRRASRFEIGGLESRSEASVEAIWRERRGRAELP